MLALGAGLTGCAAVERTFVAPPTPEGSRGATLARETGYPSVFSPPSERPPLLTPAEQQAAKTTLEKQRATQTR